MPQGNPRNVRLDPGWLYVAPLASTEPTSFTGDWDPTEWTLLGYTDAGPEFQMEQTFERVRVAEEIDPIATLQTERNTMITVALAELTAQNLKIALNGGEVDIAGAVTKFEPPAAGDITHVMIGWDSTDGLERWIFRKCLSTGNIAIPRRRAPEKAVVPVTFEVLIPDQDEYDNTSPPPWVMYHDTDYIASES